MSSQVETSAAIQTENQDFNSGIQSSTENVNVSSESTINSNSNSTTKTATDSIPSVSISSQPIPQSQSKEIKPPPSSLQDSIIIPIKTDPIPGCHHLSNLSKPSLDNLLQRYRSGLRWGEKTRIGQVVELGKENDGQGEGEKDGPPGKRRKLLPHPTCLTCSSVLSKPFLCLESAKIFCFSTSSDDHTNDSKCHLRSHLQSQLQSRDQENKSSTSTSDKESNGGVDLNTSKDPVLACEIHSGSLFCAECDDLVYDERFEEVLRQEKHSVKGNGKKKEEKEMNGDGVEKKEVTEGEDIVLLPAPCKVPRGLRNLGATCFMNVVLQSFFHNPLLRNFFLSDRHSVGLCAWKDNCLACELGVLFEEFYAPAPSAHSHAAPYGPTTFLFCIWLARESAELTSAGQHDAHELFISALNGVHAALIASRKRVSKTGILPQWPHESPSSSTSTLTNQDPQPSPTFQNSRHHLNGISSSESQSCPCAVHRTFSGTIQSEVTCASCGLSSSTLDPVLDLSLDIRPPNWKNTNPSKVDPNNVNGSTYNPVINSEKPVKKNKKKEKEEKEKKEKKEREEADKKDEVEQDVEQCLRRYCAPERLSSSDYTCQHCGQLSRATKQLSLARLPPVLCIQLKRFEHNSSATKINTRVRFPQRLDVREFCTDAVRHANFRTKNGGGGEEALMEEKSAPGMSSDPDAYAYDLFTVIVHEGGMNTGHYRNFSKWKGEWYHFDDDKVTPCSISSVLDVRAYQLFYVRRNLQNVNSH